MNSALFITGATTTLISALIAVRYLRAPLRALLIELCGTGERAAFWAVFSNVTITLVPVIFAMQYVPEPAPGRTAVVEVATQLKWGLAGLLGAVVILGFVLSRFIPKHAAGPRAAAEEKAA